MWSYREGAYVRWEGHVYRAAPFPVSNPPFENIDIEPTAAGTAWEDTTFEQYIQNDSGRSDFEYSPWTKGKQQAWINWCGNPQSRSFHDSDGSGNQASTPCIGDSNWVIREETSGAWRDSVDFRLSQLLSSGGDALLRAYLYPATSVTTSYIRRQYEGMRILCDVEPNVNPANSNLREFVSQFL